MQVPAQPGTPVGDSAQARESELIVRMIKVTVSRFTISFTLPSASSFWPDSQWLRVQPMLRTWGQRTRRLRYLHKSSPRWGLFEGRGRSAQEMAQGNRRSRDSSELTIWNWSLGIKRAICFLLLTSVLAIANDDEMCNLDISVYPFPSASPGVAKRFR